MRAERTARPTVSVAMGTCNGAQYLADQIASIVSQSSLPDELVIADDASTDGTRQLLDDLSKRCPFEVRVLGASNRVGIPRNFERAISACRGSLIMLADQDDIWSAHKVSRAVEIFTSSPGVAYTFSNAELIDASGQLLPGTLWGNIGLEPHRMQAYRRGEQLMPLLRGRNFIYGMSMTFRADLLPWILPITSTSASCGHDTWISLVLAGLGLEGRAIDEPLLRYRQHRAQAVSAGPDVSTFLGAARASFAAGRPIDPHLASDLRAIADRLAGFPGVRAETIQAAQLMRERALHLDNRREICAAAWHRRAWLIAREAGSGRYGVFSQGLKTALRDLIA